MYVCVQNSVCVIKKNKIIAQLEIPNPEKEAENIENSDVASNSPNAIDAGTGDEVDNDEPAGKINLLYIEIIELFVFVDNNGMASITNELSYYY